MKLEVDINSVATNSFQTENQLIYGQMFRARFNSNSLIYINIISN